MLRSAAALGLALGLLVVAACGGSATIPQQRLSHLVLRERDLGRPFSAFNSGPQTQLDNQGTPRADGARFGREGGWIARYRRPGSPATEGPLLVESRADLFSSAGGAKKDLEAYRATLAAVPGVQRRPLALPQIGDAALGVTFEQPGAVPLRFFRIAWRYRNATASVTVEGFGRKVRLADALVLVRRQQRLIAQP